MLHLIIRFRSLLRDVKGQDLIEYALLAGIIALGSVVFMDDVSIALNALWTGVETELTNALP